MLKIGIYTHRIDLKGRQKFETNSPTGSENIGARSWKIWKSHGRLDPTFRMREVVHARSIEFLRVRNDRLLSGRILCDKEIFFYAATLYIVEFVSSAWDRTSLVKMSRCRIHVNDQHMSWHFSKGGAIKGGHKPQICGSLTKIPQQSSRIKRQVLKDNQYIGGSVAAHA